MLHWRSLEMPNNTSRKETSIHHTPDRTARGQYASGAKYNSFNRTTRFYWESNTTEVTTNHQKCYEQKREEEDTGQRRNQRSSSYQCGSCRAGWGGKGHSSISHCFLTAFVYSFSLEHLSHNCKLCASRAPLFCPLLYLLCLRQCQNRERQLQTLQFQKMVEKEIGKHAWRHSIFDSSTPRC